MEDRKFEDVRELLAEYWELERESEREARRRRPALLRIQALPEPLRGLALQAYIDGVDETRGFVREHPEGPYGVGH